MNATDLFIAMGVDVENVNISEALEKLDDERLFEVFDSFLTAPVELGVDEKSHIAARNALVNAYVSGSAEISPDDYYAARNALDEDDSESEDAEDSSGSVESDESTKATRGRRSEGLKEIYELVKDNPTATSTDVLEHMVGSGLSDSTVVSYYYRARNEFGLAGTGKRGRRPNDTAERVLELVSAGFGKETTEGLIGSIAEEFGLTESTAKVYYYRAVREIRDA